MPVVVPRSEGHSTSGPGVEAGRRAAGATEAAGRFSELAGRVAGPDFAGRHVVAHHRAHADHRALADVHPVGDRRRLPDDDAALESRPAADLGVAGDEDVFADVDVVADVGERPDTAAAAQDGVAQGAALDDGLGADVDVVLDQHAAELGEPHPSLRRGRARTPCPRSR